MEDANGAKEKLLNIINFEYFYKAIISNPIKKGEGTCFKAVISKTFLKKCEGFQISFFTDGKVTHENILISEERKEETFKVIAERIISIMSDNFKQCNLYADKTVTLLMNKKRLFTVTGIKENSVAARYQARHDEEKNYIIKEGVYEDWLYETGLIDKRGKVHDSMHKKFRQINRFTEIIADAERYIPEGGVIADLGCGKSYLTFAAYYYFNVVKKKNVFIKGFDLKKDVVDKCGDIARRSGFTNLEFFAGDIKDIGVSEKIDMLITLHACDTATDIAISWGVKSGAKVIMSVPCCQHELSGQVKNEALDEILSYGILKERFCAWLTDGIRAETLKLCGYKTSVMEFIDTEHTPKNIMIRAVKNDGYKHSEKDLKKYLKLLEEFNVNPAIYRFLNEEIKGRIKC